MMASCVLGNTYCSASSVSLRLCKKDGSIRHSFRCGGYASQINTCTAHSISANNVEALLLSAVKRLSRFVLQDEEAFAAELQSLWADKQEAKPPGLSRPRRFIDNDLVNEFGEHHIGHFGGVFIFPYQGNEMLNIKGLCLFFRNGGFQLVHPGFKVCLFAVILRRKLLVLPFGEQAGHEKERLARQRAREKVSREPETTALNVTRKAGSVPKSSPPAAATTLLGMGAKITSYSRRRCVTISSENGGSPMKNRQKLLILMAALLLLRKETLVSPARMHSMSSGKKGNRKARAKNVEVLACKTLFMLGMKYGDKVEQAVFDRLKERKLGKTEKES